MAESWLAMGSSLGSVPEALTTWMRLAVTTVATEVAKEPPASRVPTRMGVKLSVSLLITRLFTLVLPLFSTRMQKVAGVPLVASR
jgi:hypothetical protein